MELSGGGKRQQRGDRVTQPASQPASTPQTRTAAFIIHIPSSLDKSVDLELDPQQVNCRFEKQLLANSVGPALGQCFTIVGPLLDQYWTIAGPVLDQRWTSFGPVLDQCWTSGGLELDQHWTSIGPVLDQRWTSTGPASDWC